MNSWNAEFSGYFWTRKRSIIRVLFQFAWLYLWIYLECSLDTFWLGDSIVEKDYLKILHCVKFVLCKFLELGEQAESSPTFLCNQLLIFVWYWLRLLMTHFIQVVSGTICAYAAYLNLTDNNWDVIDDSRRGNFASSFEFKKVQQKNTFLSETFINPVIFI